MNCASCAVKLEKSLQNLSGVREAVVNFAAGNVSLDYEPKKVSFEQLARVVSSLGDYELVPQQKIESSSRSPSANETADSKTGSKNAEDPDQAKLKTKLIWGGILSAVSLLLGFSSFIPFLNSWPENLVRIISFAVTTPVVVWVGATFYIATYKQFKKLSFGMSSLIGIGTAAAYLYSTLVTFAPGIFSGIANVAVFFDSAAVIIFLVLLGRFLENKAKKNTALALKKLLGLKSKKATVLRGGREFYISIEEIKASDHIVVKPGEKIPVDGVVLGGEASVDESMVTGESLPAPKSSGAHVIGGTLNKNGRLVIKATTLGRDSFLDQIVKLVQQAQSSKAPIQRWVDKVSEFFVPIVMVIALLSFVIWLLSGAGLPLALIIAVSVLVIACPCALGLATPTAIITGTGRAAARGILFRSAESLEQLHKAQTIILDKTGTITEGRPRLGKIQSFSEESREQVLTRAAALAKNSTHPLSAAIVEATTKKPAKDSTKPSSLEEIPGSGIKAKIGSDNLLLGNLNLLEQAGLANNKIDRSILKKAREWEQQGFSVLYLASNLKIIGLLGLRDQIKKDSFRSIKTLKEMGLTVIMMSGDNLGTAQAIANQAGIKKVYAPVLPQDKAKKVAEIDRRGRTVAMVGDGINDAPALARADVGIAMGAGTDIAIETADVTLLASDLSQLIEAIRVSKKTVGVIKQNLVWALGYNTLLIPLAAGLLFPAFGILVNPIFAAGAMALSSLSVVLNSLRLNPKFDIRQ